MEGVQKRRGAVLMINFLTKHGEDMTTILVSRLRGCAATGEASRLVEEAANEIERLAREAWTWSKACETATKQLEPVRIDAERYRWLKRQPWVKTKGIHAWGTLLDDAIDEARHDAPDEFPNAKLTGLAPGKDNK